MPNDLATRDVAEVQSFLEGNATRLAQVCAKHLTPERVIQLAVLCTYKTPKLAQCDRGSLLSAIVQASSLGLDLSPSAGEAYLIPRWNGKTKSLECQFQPGYQGLAKLARQSGQVAFIQARLVYAADTFRVYYNNASTSIEHEPAAQWKQRGPVTHAYAVAKLACGDTLVEVMATEDVEAIRARSQSPTEGPWVTDWGEMAKKTAIRRLCKSLPKSAELVAAIESHDADFELGTFDGPALPKPPQNDSGHGRGQYASAEQTEAYLKAMTAYLDKRNAQWLDRWTQADGSLPDGIKRDLCNRWQADNHLLKWATQTGRLDEASYPESGQKNRQIGRYTAIVYHRSKRDQTALADELRRYLDEEARRAEEKLRGEEPELFPAEEIDQSDPDEASDAWEDGRE